MGEFVAKKYDNTSHMVWWNGHGMICRTDSLGNAARIADALNAQAAPPAAAVSAEPAPNPESADFKAGMVIGRAESEFLAGAIKNPACGLCGATCEKDAEAKCRPGGDSCPGTEWPLANLWALQAPPSAVPGGYNEDEIADACMMAEVPYSKCEAIIAYLGNNRRAMIAAAERKGEP